MKIQYKFLLTFFLFIVIGFLFYSTWVQWQGNQESRIERMKPIKPTAEFKNSERIHAMTFSPTDSDIFATADEGIKTKIWSINGIDNPIKTFAFESKNPKERLGRVKCLAFSKSGEWLLNKSFSTLIFWHVSTGKEISIDSFTAAVSPVEDILAIGLRDIRLWDYSNPNDIKPLFVLPPMIGGKSLTHVEAEELKPHVSLVFNQHYQNITLSNDGRWIAASGELYDKSRSRHINMVKVWNLSSEELVKIIERPPPNDLNEKNYRRNIQSIRFSPNNRFFAITGSTGIIIWSLPEWRIYRERIDQLITDIAFSPDEELYAIVSLGQITLLDLDTDTPVALLKGNSILSIYNSVVFSPDGKTLVSTGFEGELSIWNIEKIK